jgi:hypothetical protein
VPVPVTAAFDVFTLEIDAWWRTGPAYRVGGTHQGALHLEPRLCGRVFQAYAEDGAAVHEIGVITSWEPPTHLAFTWRGINFALGESTTVEVWFEAREGGTRVTLEHRGFASLRADHPVRHGQPVPAFGRQMGLWWGGLMTSLREHTEVRSDRW